MSSWRCQEFRFFSIRKEFKENWCQIVGRNCPKRPLFCCEDHINFEEDIENYEEWVLGGKPRLKLNVTPKIIPEKTGKIRDKALTIQAKIQLIISLIAIAQYYCVIDFMRTYPLLIFIRILYFHNAKTCGGDINIGESIDGMANQAYVYLSSTPQTAQRTFIFSYVSLGLSVLWLLGSIQLIKGGFNLHHSNHTHWPWLSVTFLVSLLDMIGAVVYINDSFYTRTLSDLLQFANGTPSGLGNANPSTQWASWTMAALYGRFGIFLVINVALIVCAIWDCTRFRSSVTSSELERHDITSPESSSQTKPDSPEGSNESSTRTPCDTLPKIPRPGLSQSFSSMKDLLFRRANSTDSLNAGRNRNRVNFVPEETTSYPIHIPPSFENLIAEQQRRLNGAAVDTSGRYHAPQPSSSLPQLDTNAPETPRNPARQQAGQMPWAYIAGAPTNRMRDQLPPDEDLPPVPLPDYTALQSARKASELNRSSGSIKSELSYTEEGVFELEVLSPGVNAGRCVVLEAKPASARPIKRKVCTHISQDIKYGKPMPVSYTTLYTGTKEPDQYSTSSSSEPSDTNTAIYVPTKKDSDNSDNSLTLSLTPPLPVRGVPPLPIHVSPGQFTSFGKLPRTMQVRLVEPETLNTMFPRPLLRETMISPDTFRARTHAHFTSYGKKTGVVTPNVVTRNELRPHVLTPNVRPPDNVQTLPFRQIVGEEPRPNCLDMINSNINIIVVVLALLTCILLILVLYMTNFVSEQYNMKYKYEFDTNKYKTK